MYDDVESDFWKEIFVHLQHKNMVRCGAERLYLQDCDKAFERFSIAHPDIQAEITKTETYATWEIFISDNVKLRLFIQNQIKGSLMQKSGGDLVKIADAKFPNNPFPEIEEFLSRRNDYLRELHSKIDFHVRDMKKQKLFCEFIKAHLIKKFKNQKDIIWTLEPLGKDFKLMLQDNSCEKELILTCDNYINQIASL